MIGLRFVDTSRSATLMLEAWCPDHRLAKEPSIVAEVVKRLHLFGGFQS